MSERFEFDGRCWTKYIAVVDYDGTEDLEKWSVSITDVPVETLLSEYEDMVVELSDKELELYRLKEAYLIAENDIIANTDFKALYGANNQKVRDNHVKSELADMHERIKGLEFSISFIKSYTPLLRDVVRCKQ